MDPAALPLRDIHPPAPVGWWPPAPGWWLLLVLALALAAALWWWRRRPRRGANPGVLARRELAAIRAAFERHGDPRRLAAELSVLMRRAALTRAPRRSVAGLTGQSWLEHLDDRAGALVFSDGPGRALLDAPYRASAQFDTAGLLDACTGLVEAIAREARS